MVQHVNELLSKLRIPVRVFIQLRHDPRSYWRVQIEDTVSCIVCSDHVGHSLIEWISGIFLGIQRYRHGHRDRDQKIRDLRGMLWYVSNDTNSDKFHVAILLMDNGFGEAVRDSTTNISTLSPSESTSSPSPSPSPSSSSPSSSSSSSSPSSSSNVLTKKGYNGKVQSETEFKKRYRYTRPPIATHRKSHTLKVDGGS